MGPLKFICPLTGNEVDTGVEMDPDTFERLSGSMALPCPHCGDEHNLAGVDAWLEGEEGDPN
jgi:hypothetical protein